MGSNPITAIKEDLMQKEVRDAVSEGKVSMVLTLLEMKLLPTTGRMYEDAFNILSKSQMGFSDSEIHYWLGWFDVKPH